MDKLPSRRLMKRFYSRALLKEIELKWRRGCGSGKDISAGRWETAAGKYILPMFPYPSGNLHMGHVRVYSISDCLAQFESLKKRSDSDGGESGEASRFRVLHPMGWDAFGLPAENAAISAAIQPSQWTQQNISHMRSQLKELGYRFNWDRELETCDPNYYKWTQWLFLKMHERGWAYRAEAPVSWDPVDKTVLAAEQVDANGRSWRSGALVEKRMLSQWYWKITDFAEDLLGGLDGLEWPEAVKGMQRHWIGKIEGATIEFALESNKKIKGTFSMDGMDGLIVCLLLFSLHDQAGDPSPRPIPRLDPEPPAKEGEVGGEPADWGENPSFCRRACQGKCRGGRSHGGP